MSQQTYPFLVNRQPANSAVKESDGGHTEPIAARRLSDKASLLRPLQDQHLLEVYREAKKMNLSSEFIELLEEAIALRQLDHLKEA